MVKAVVMMMMAGMMLVMPVSPRPHQTQKGGDKIECAVSEFLNDIEAAILGSARKIESFIDQTIQEKMSEESANKEKQGAAIVSAAAANSDINKQTVFRNVLAKMFANKHASELNGVVPSLPGSSRDATTATSTTTMDPLEEYCKEACEAGVGGPECDCPDHPIG